MRLNLTQPVTKSGQLHWAFNDISNYRTPACNALMAELYSTSANYLATNEVQQGTQPVDYSLVQTVDDQDAPQVSSGPWVWKLEFRVFRVLVSILKTLNRIEAAFKHDVHDGRSGACSCSFYQLIWCAMKHLRLLRL